MLTITTEIARRLAKDGMVNLAVLIKIDKIVARKDSHQKEHDFEKVRHESKKRELGIKLAEIQKDCGHEVTHYSGDPSGGSDSCYICEICGKEL